MNLRFLHLIFIAMFSIAGIVVHAADQRSSNDATEMDPNKTLVETAVLSERSAISALDEQERREVSSVSNDKSPQALRHLKKIRKKYSELKKAALIQSRLEFRARLEKNNRAE